MVCRAGVAQPCSSRDHVGQRAEATEATRDGVEDVHATAMLRASAYTPEHSANLSGLSCTAHDSFPGATGPIRTHRPDAHTIPRLGIRRQAL